MVLPIDNVRIINSPIIMIDSKAGSESGIVKPSSTGITML